MQAPPVPEPASIAMLGLGVPAVLLAARRRRRS
ncbi:PEP-CTERM sorting domain-containing protein [Duganella fentianensis]